MATSRSAVRQSALDAGFRSGLEQDIADQLKKLGVPVRYETQKISYRVEETREYCPDFHLGGLIYVEGKGRFTTADRKKHLLIQRQHPFLDIRFVFSNSSNKIRKGSKTTYGDWCKKHGFLYADKTIPLEWIKEAKR
jgi:hypothetical protein